MAKNTKNGATIDRNGSVEELTGASVNPSANTPLSRFRQIVRAAAIRDADTSDKPRSKAKVTTVKGTIPDGEKIGLSLNRPVTVNSVQAITESLSTYGATASDSEPTPGTKTSLVTTSVLTPTEAVAAYGEICSL